MEIPKVSVVVPIYNVEQYIARCAESLFNQSLDSIEFIFVDDCSPDRSIEILEQVVDKYRQSIEEKDYSVRIERMPTNRGLPSVRRHGIQLSSGEYVIHCDSDDWGESDMYSVLYNEAKKKDADIVISDYFISKGDDNKHIKQIIPASKDELLGSLIDGKVHSSVCNKLVKRTLYENIKQWPTANMREDMALMVQLVFYANSFAYVSMPLYHIYENMLSISKCRTAISVKKRFMESVQNYNLIFNFLLDNKSFERFKRDLYICSYCIKEDLFCIGNFEGRKSLVDSNVSKLHHPPPGVVFIDTSKRQVKIHAH